MPYEFIMEWILFFNKRRCVSSIWWSYSGRNKVSLINCFLLITFYQALIKLSCSCKFFTLRDIVLFTFLFFLYFQTTWLEWRRSNRPSCSFLAILVVQTNWYSCTGCLRHSPLPFLVNWVFSEILFCSYCDHWNRWHVSTLIWSWWHEELFP